MEIEDRAEYLTDLIEDVAVFSRGERLMFGEATYRAIKNRLKELFDSEEAIDSILTMITSVIISSQQEKSLTSAYGTYSAITNEKCSYDDFKGMYKSGFTKDDKNKIIEFINTFGEEFMVDVIHYGIVLCLNDEDLTKEEIDTLYEFVR